MQSATMRELLEASDQEADRAFKSLSPRLEALPGSHELLRLHGLAVDVAKDLASLTRNADLFVGTRPYGDPEGRYRIEEEVLFGGGRSCLFLPPGGTPHRQFSNIVIAWDGSRESARAVAEAMPFLVRAARVQLLHVASPVDDVKGAEKELARITLHLRHHGVEPEVAVVPFVNSTGEAMEAFAHQQNADLLVMGAYGHARLIEFVFGGATRYVLRHATLPVLMAH
jgi:nucleotide-binding universal stress UspA family protein